MAAITWDGLDELEQALEALPEDLAEAGTVIAESAAYTCAAAIRGAYPRRSGELADKVIVRERRGRLGIVLWVQNEAAYAYAFESGRHRGTRGTTPARPTFIPKREQYQRGYGEAIAALLISRGLKVSGSYFE